MWAIVDNTELSIGAAHDCPASQGVIFAPGIRVLPEGSPLVLATLPVLDWNAELMNALRTTVSPARPNCYAAVMMIDPFPLWEDLGDLLIDQGFAGVVNFPPASLVEVKQGQSSPQEGNTIEIDRMKWFHEIGLGLVYAASRTEEISTIELRLSGLLDAIVSVPVSSLHLPISESLLLGCDPEINADRRGAPPILSLR